MAQIRTQSEMFPLVESWHKSGLTQKQFSHQHGVSEHVFCYWISRYRKAHPGSAVTTRGEVGKTERVGSAKPVPVAGREPAFIRLSPPAAVVAAPAAVVTDPDTAVELPSGVVLRFTGLVPVSYLKELVGLSSVCSCSA